MSTKAFLSELEIASLRTNLFFSFNYFKTRRSSSLEVYFPIYSHEQIAIKYCLYVSS